LNLRQALGSVRKALRNKDFEDASIEGEILLRHILKVERAYLFSHLDDVLTSFQEDALKKVLARRIQEEPVSYIIGHKEFYGLDFIVDNRVLIPRPESELMVEKTIEIVKKQKITTIADIGTGSGAIAISLAVNLPDVIIHATDISKDALEVARQNCKKHRVEDRIVLLQGDLLEPLPGTYDLIVANLPYVKTADIKEQKSLRFEPGLTLDGGEAGLDVIGKAVRQADKKLNKKGCMIIEIGQGQAESVCELIKKEYPTSVIQVYPDLAGIARIIRFCLT
jgi:release factor glutamine methyltransferase